MLGESQSGIFTNTTCIRRNAASDAQNTETACWFLFAAAHAKVIDDFSVAHVEISGVCSLAAVLLPECSYCWCFSAHGRLKHPSQEAQMSAGSADIPRHCPAKIRKGPQFFRCDCAEGADFKHGVRSGGTGQGWAYWCIYSIEWLCVLEVSAT